MIIKILSVISILGIFFIDSGVVAFSKPTVEVDKSAASPTVTEKEKTKLKLEDLVLSELVLPLPSEKEIIKQKKPPLLDGTQSKSQ